MSLINDALKQASRSPQTSSFGGTSGSSGILRPVERPRSGGGMSFAMGLVMVLLLAGAGWFFWQWWQAGKTGNAFNIARLVQSAKSLIPNKHASTTSNQDEKLVTPSATTTPENGAKEGNFMSRVFNSSPADPAHGAPFPSVKVQGIYFRVGDSTVLINGKNLSEGEAIEGVTIAKIERQTVTLQFQGQTKEVTLR